MYDFEDAQTRIWKFKCHVVRAVNQDRAKQAILDNLKSDEALLTMDWAMKFIPTKFREAQQDWFGKRGISWHVSAIITKQADEDFVVCVILNGDREVIYRKPHQVS